MQTNNEQNNVAKAIGKIESIKQAILSGDKKLTAGDLTRAKSELEFAELQMEAEIIQNEQAIKASRKADLLELQKQLTTISDSQTVIDKKFKNFEKSLDDYLSSVVGYQKDLRSVSDALSNGGFLANQTPGQIKEMPASVGRNVEIGEIVAGGIQPQETIEKLVERRLGEFGQELRRK